MVAENNTVFQEFLDNDPAKKQADINNLRVLRNLNMALDNPSVYSKSGNTGNYPIKKDLLALEDHTLESVVMSELHGGLRALCGDLGKKLDRTSLPQSLQDKIALLSQLEKNYRAAVAPATKLYTEIFGTEDNPNVPGGCPMYTDKARMDKVLSDYSWFHMDEDDVKIWQDSKEKAESINEEVEAVLETMSEEFSQVDKFILKGHGEIRNSSSTYITNFAKWLFYIEHAARSFMDTTVTPQAYRSAIYHAVRKQQYIVNDLCDHMITQNDARQPVLMQSVNNGIQKMEKSFVSCAPFEELNKTQRIRNVLKALDMDENRYDAVKQDMTKPAEPVVKKCPYGFG